jgi:hypothetical protein
MFCHFIVIKTRDKLFSEHSTPACLTNPSRPDQPCWSVPGASPLLLALWLLATSMLTVLLLLLLPMSAPLLLLPPLLLLFLPLCAASITTAPWGLLGAVALPAVSLAVDTLQVNTRQQRRRGQPSKI